MIGKTGQIEAAIGTATNCVRADGSTGPCDSDALTTELNNRPTKGQGYLPARAAVIGATGQLEAAAGASNHCVRADGSTGPCDPASLPADLSSRPTKGAGYIVSRAAVISPTGTLEAAAGSPNDCVKVDGTSGPCGSGSSSSLRFVDGETPSGTINGFNVNFFLSATPLPASSLQLFRNGLLQRRGIDFNLSGNLLSFLPVSVPQSGDVLAAYFRY